MNGGLHASVQRLDQHKKMQEIFDRFQRENVIRVEDYKEVRDDVEFRVVKLHAPGGCFSYPDMPSAWTAYDLIAYVIRTSTLTSKYPDFDEWCKITGIETKNTNYHISVYNTIKTQGKELRSALGADLYSLLVSAYWAQYK